MTMNIGLSGIELTGLAGPGGSFSGRPEKSAVKYFKLGFIWLAAVVIASLAARILLYGYAGNSAESEPARVATAATEPAPAPTLVTTVTQDGSTFDPATAEAVTPAQTAPLDGLNISSHSCRSGRLPPNPLFPLTPPQPNHYPL